MTPPTLADQDVVFFFVSNRSITSGNWDSSFRKAEDVVSPSILLDESSKVFLERLRSISRQASTPDWDGYGAKPISRGTLGMALALFGVLPKPPFPMPDVSPHPDGELAFEWYLGPGRLLTVAVNESGRLNYAAMIGQAQKYGTEYLGDELPDEISAALRRVRFEGLSPVR